MTRSNGLPSLTWVMDAKRKRTCSNLGHVITGSRTAVGFVVYNAWSGEPGKSKHLEQGYQSNGLAACKAACERHAASTQGADA